MQYDVLEIYFGSILRTQSMPCLESLTFTHERGWVPVPLREATEIIHCLALRPDILPWLQKLHIAKNCGQYGQWEWYADFEISTRRLVKFRKISVLTIPILASESKENIESCASTLRVCYPCSPPFAFFFLKPIFIKVINWITHLITMPIIGR